MLGCRRARSTSNYETNEHGALAALAVIDRCIFAQQKCLPIGSRHLSILLLFICADIWNTFIYTYFVLLHFAVINNTFTHTHITHHALADEYSIGQFMVLFAISIRTQIQRCGAHSFVRDSCGIICVDYGRMNSIEWTVWLRNRSICQTFANETQNNQIQFLSAKQKSNSAQCQCIDNDSKLCIILLSHFSIIIS